MEDNEIHTKFFSLKVLTCIYDLQMSGDNMPTAAMNANAGPNTSCVAGITIDEIVEQMCRRFITDGDVEAQVLISLKQICHKGLVGKVKDRYKLVGPMARILLMTHRNCERKRQIEKIQRIFFNNCVGTTPSISIPRLRSQSQRKCQKRSRTKDFDVPERPKRSRTKEIIEPRNSRNSRKNSKQSVTSRRKHKKRSRRCLNDTKQVVIRDLVDFLQYDDSISSILSSFPPKQNPEIITILPEINNCKSYQSESLCYYDRIKKCNSGNFSKK